LVVGKADKFDYEPKLILYVYLDD